MRTFLALGAALVACAVAASPATAWKGPTHLFAAEHALLDVQDGTLTIPDVGGDPADAVTVEANATIAEALKRYPEAFRAGVIGPDAFPDLITGQTLIHPETDDSFTDEWLAYLWEQAWRPGLVLFAHDVAVDFEDELRNIAFATGFLAGHANGDVWAHTLINAPDFAAGSFPSLSEDMAGARIAVKHIVVEAYIDKHRPGNTASLGYALDAPDEFVATTLVMSDFARRHGRHPVLAPFVERYLAVAEEIEELEFDRTHQDCLFPAADDCTRYEHGGHFHHVCELDGCVGNPTDLPLNLLEAPGNLATSAYLEAWLGDLEAGIVGFITMSDRIARELHSGKALNEAELGDALNDWVYGHVPSMLGLPDFVGDGLLWTNDVLAAILAPLVACTGPEWAEARRDPVLGSFYEGACDLHDAIKDDVEELAQGIADDLLDGLLTNAFGLERVDPQTFAALDLNGNGDLGPFELVNLIKNPVAYLDDRRLFAEGDRALIDAHMGVPAGADDDERGFYHPYAPDEFAALKNTMVLAQLALLDADGLNEFFRAKAARYGDADALDDLYFPYVNYSTSTAPGWPVPTNVMLGWIRSLDGDHQWRTTSLFPPREIPGEGPSDPPAVWFTAESGPPRTLKNGFVDRSGGVGTVSVSGVVTDAQLPGFDDEDLRMHGGPKHLVATPNGVAFTGAVVAEGCCNWSVIGSYSGAWDASKPDPLQPGALNVRPTGITRKANGTIYFTDVGRNAIGTVSNGSFGETPLPGPGRVPRGITVGPDGNIWFTEQGGNRIGRLESNGTIVEFPIPIANSQPIGITAGPDGALWFTMNAAYFVGRITTSGAITVYPAPGLNGQGITAGPDGAVWYVATGASKVVRVSMSGSLTSWTIPNTGTSIAPTPVEIALGADGNLWFTQKGDHEIGRITPAGVITEFKLPSLLSPYGIVGAPKVATRPPTLAPTVFGTGRMWLWEDCVSRRAVFRTTFHEPVHGHTAFADAGDPWKALTDTQAPTVDFEVDGPAALVDGTRYVGSGAKIVIEAIDDYDPRQRVSLGVEHGRVGATPASVVDAANPYVVELGDGDGAYAFAATSSDACANETDGVEQTFVLDTAPPVTTIAEPSAPTYESDDVVTVDFEAVDAGAGIASAAAAAAGRSVADGDELDMFFLAPGTHELVVTARDRVGNEATTRRSFVVQATAESLKANVDKALTLGLITSADVHEGLADKLVAADASHDAGRHRTEHNQLRAFTNQLRAQRGKAVDAATADRLTAFAEELIASGR